MKLNGSSKRGWAYIHLILRVLAFCHHIVCTCWAHAQVNVASSGQVILGTWDNQNSLQYLHTPLQNPENSCKWTLPASLYCLLKSPAPATS